MAQEHGDTATRTASQAVTEADVRAQVGDISANAAAVALVARYLTRHEDPEGVDVEAAYKFALHAQVNGPSSTAFLWDLGTYSVGTYATARDMAGWMQRREDREFC